MSKQARHWVVTSYSNTERTHRRGRIIVEATSRAEAITNASCSEHTASLCGYRTLGEARMMPGVLKRARIARPSDYPPAREIES